MSKKSVYRIISAAAALILWQLLSLKVGSDMLLASPFDVLKRLAVIWREAGFLKTVGFSFFRISAGFLLAFAFGTLLGLAAGYLPVIEHLLWPYVVTVKTVPVASFIIFSLIWLDYRSLTILISFMIAFPAIYSNVLQGVRSAPPEMIEMAQLYRLPWHRRLLFIYLPSVKPYLLSACGVSAGMAWKSGIAAEVIGMVDGSIGEMLYRAKIYFLNADLLCWTVIIVILSILSEKLFTFLLKRVFGGLEKL